MHHPTNRIAHTTAFVTPVLEQRLEREIAYWLQQVESVRRLRARRADALPLNYVHGWMGGCMDTHTHTHTHTHTLSFCIDAFNLIIVMNSYVEVG